MKFTKPATSITDQLALLRRRGMVIDDEPAARHYLQHISYYRLRAYWLTYEAPAAVGDHAFRPGTRFEDVLALYVFDRHLRLLVMDAIERVEVALRAGWAHHMAMTYGSHGYLDPAHHDSVANHANGLDCPAGLTACPPPKNAARACRWAAMAGPRRSRRRWPSLPRMVLATSPGRTCVSMAASPATSERLRKPPCHAIPVTTKGGT